MAALEAEATEIVKKQVQMGSFVKADGEAYQAPGGSNKDEISLDDDDDDDDEESEATGILTYSKRGRREDILGWFYVRNLSNPSLSLASLSLVDNRAKLFRLRVKCARNIFSLCNLSPTVPLLSYEMNT